MAYEIDFIGINEETKDADAIAMRWKIATGGYIIGVYDGGIQAYGKQLQTILNSYYFGVNEDPKVIDFVVVSHSDMDHTAGLKMILENFTVKALYMNRPWQHVDDIYDSKTDGRITKESLKSRLKKDYKYVAELEDIAEVKDIPIYDIFQGDVIENKLTVLSPTKEMYQTLVVTSKKTKYLAEEKAKEVGAEGRFDFIYECSSETESWSDEKLKEDETTSNENEMSAVLLGEMDGETFLLTGDAGIMGLETALDYAEEIEKPLDDTVKVYQIPHHGGRHNISSTIMDRLVGENVEEGTTSKKTAIASAAKNSDHPLQMTVNAFIRRGAKVYKTDGATHRHYNGNMPTRKGWTTASCLEFKEEVEAWK